MTNTDVQEQVRRLTELEEECPQCRYTPGTAFGYGILGAIPQPCQACKGTGKVPLIRTAAGRTLRRECEHFLPGWGAGGVGAEEHLASCTGWLPVGEDEARAVCEDWLHKEGLHITIQGAGIVISENSGRDKYYYRSVIHDHDVASALFEAVEQAIGKEA